MSDTGGLYFHNDVVDGLAVSSGKAGDGGNTAGNVRAQGQLPSDQDEAGEIPPSGQRSHPAGFRAMADTFARIKRGVDAGVE